MISQEMNECPTLYLSFDEGKYVWNNGPASLGISSYHQSLENYIESTTKTLE